MITITSADKNKRLDLVIAAHLPKLTRTAGQALIKNKKVLVNKKPAKTSYRVEMGDIITVDTTIIDTPALFPVKKTLNIIFEDNNIIVIDKPAGLNVHPSEHSTEATLAHYLLSYYPPIGKVGEDNLRPGIVHRLDKLTSGVMIAAKNNSTFNELKLAWQNGLVYKKYIALVWGSISEAGSIESGIARSKRTGKMVAVKEGGRKAVTYFKPIKAYTNSTLLEVRTITGRTHQIRAHFKSLGQPVVGDPLYKYKKQPSKTFPRVFLHSSSLSLPYKNIRQNFTSELPLDFSEYLNTLKLKK